LRSQCLAEPCEDADMTSPNKPELPASALPADAVILDVREPDVWTAGHIETAVHIPMGQVSARLSDLPQGDPLYVTCRGGGRSAKVTQFLRAQGIDALNVAGGMKEWSAAGRPMVSDTGRPPEVI